jgi:hypothetical protein
LSWQFDRDHPVTHSLDGLGLIRIEDDFPKKTTGRIVHMNDSIFRSLQSLKRPLDQISSSRGQDLNPNIIGNFIVLDQVLNKVEIRLRGSGIGDLDLLEPEGDEVTEETEFLGIGHGWEASGFVRLGHDHIERSELTISKTLVSISQVSRKPDRSLLLNSGGPLSLREWERLVWPVFGGRIRAAKVENTDDRSDLRKTKLFELYNLQHAHFGGILSF